MKMFLRMCALLTVLAFVGCDSNPGGPDVGTGKNESGTDNTVKEGTKTPAKAGKRGGGSAEAPAPTGTQ
jgi:hypothetical protein